MFLDGFICRRPRQISWYRYVSHIGRSIYIHNHKGGGRWCDLPTKHINLCEFAAVDVTLFFGTDSSAIWSNIGVEMLQDLDSQAAISQKLPPNSLKVKAHDFKSWS